MKTQGWEKRLADYFEEMRDKPFKRGVNDCALFAGNCVDLMTGLNTTEEFRRPYKSRKQAYTLLKELGYNDLTAVAMKKLGDPLPGVAYAKRGDVVLVEYDGQDALAIVDLSGKHAATVGKDGLMYFDMKYWSKAWEV